MRTAVAGTALLAILCAGCGQKPATPTIHSESWTDPGDVVSFKFSPAVPHTLDPTTFQVAMTDGNGHALVKQRIAIDLTMSSMTMPKTSVMVYERMPGIYVGIGQFSMAGDWKASVSIAKADGTTESHDVPIHVQ